MKQLIAGMSLILAILCASAIARAFQNEPQGFRGINWDTPLDTVKSQMDLKETNRNAKFYNRKNDSLKIGAAELRSIVYVFYKDRFSGVMIHAQALSKSDFIQAFQTQFGAGFKSNQFIDSYFWKGSTTTMLVNCNAINNQCDGSMMSSALLAEEAAEKANEAAGAKKDF